MDVASATQEASQPPVAPVLGYRASLLQKVVPRIPYTAEGLPTGFYRTDLLPNSTSTSQEELQSLSAAYTDLSFEHGYPTLPDGRPYWHKLDFEPGFAFGAFQIYLEQLDLGPRELTQLADNTELHVLSSRMAGLPDGQLIAKAALQRQVVEFSILYYWRSRSKAHDLYKEAAYRHLRLRRQMNVEDGHYTLATNLMKELQNKVLNDKEFWDNMSGKTAVDFFSKLVAVQRISVGLPAAGPLSQKETPEDMTFEMIMRTIGQKAAAGNVYENGGQSQGRGILDSVLQDREQAANMQELVIRVSQGMNKSLPNPHSGNSARQFKGRGRTNERIGQEELAAYDVSGAPGSNLDNDSAVPGDLTAPATALTMTPQVDISPAIIVSETTRKSDDAPKT